MRVGIGDAVFTRSGDPGVVQNRDQETGNLKVETHLPNVQKMMRHGYINGLPNANRVQLNEILDAAKESKDPAERVQILQNKLTELDEDPRNHMLAQYVRSEMLHIMNTHNIRPTSYSVHETKAR
jgi:ABC-type transport system substrate-binding protein